MQAKAVRTSLELIENHRKGIIPLWEGNEPLFRILENEEIKNLSKNETYTLKVAYNQKFKEKVSILNLNIKANNLEELINKIGEKGLNPQDLEYIVNSNDKKEYFKLLQNFIYLDIYPSIYTRQELAIRKFIEKIKRNLDTIKISIETTQEQLSNLKSDSAVVIEKKQEIHEILEGIKEAVETLGDDEPIKVAVFATKKAGKSMIVNALLGEEFAPTSLELPTPTVIEYHPWDEKYIRVKVGEKLEDFKTVSEVKKYLENLFKENNRDLKGGKIPVVKVFYPRKKGINYSIFDTPGPDLAGSQHGDFIDEYIKKTDVAIFVVDYSKYAQTEEIKLLEKIVKEFKNRNKENTLLIAINKLDLMYHDESTEKIKTRVADFIRHKLQLLGIEEPVVIPITALIYFYSKKLEKAFPEIKKEANIRRFLLNLEDELEENRENISVSEEIFQTVSNFVGYLKTVQKIKKPKYEDLINATGFEGLKKYINYIGIEKAILERYVSALNTIVASYTELRNRIELNKKLINKDTKKLEEILNQFLNKLNESNLKKEKKELDLGLEMLKLKLIDTLKNVLEKELEEHVKAIFNELESEKDYIKQQIISYIENSERYVNEKELEKTKREITSRIESGIADLIESYSKKLDEEYLKKYIRQFLQTSLREHFESLYQETLALQEELKQKTQSFKKILETSVEELKEILKREFDVVVDINVPELALSPILDKVIQKFSQLPIDIEENLKLDINNQLLENIFTVRDRDLLERVAVDVKFIDLGIVRLPIPTVKIEDGKYELNVNKKFIEEIFQKIKENTEKVKKTLKEQISNFTKETLEEAINNTLETFYEFKENLQKWEDSIIKPIKALKENISKEMETRRKILEMYENFEEVMDKHMYLIQETINEFEKIKKEA
jgi:hypothetical protein